MKGELIGAPAWVWDELLGEDDFENATPTLLTSGERVLSLVEQRLLGEETGHPFHGNQWTEGQGGVPHAELVQPPAAAIYGVGSPQHKLEQIHTLEKQLNADKVRITYPHSMDPTTTVGKQNIGIVHNAMTATMTAREDMRAAGVKPPAVQLRFKQLLDRDRDFESRKPDTHVYATAHGRSITINTKQPAWRSSESIDAAMKRDGISGWHPLVENAKGSDVIVHEHGHIMHAQYLQKTTGTPSNLSFSKYREMRGEKATYAPMVSRYAKTNKLEFVAETFTGLVGGKVYHQVVMDEYHALGGPRVRVKK